MTNFCVYNFGIINISHNKPMRITFKLGKNSYLQFYVAPSIDNDNQ